MSDTDRFHFCNEETLLGKGSRRRCYRMPGSALCVKFNRLASEFPPKTRLRIRWDTLLGSLFRCLNINYREWKYHQRVLLKLPEDLARVFPEFMEPVRCPKNGWGVIETLIMNADGSQPRRVDQELCDSKDAEQRQRIYEATQDLLQQLADRSICFFDPQNILLQWTGEGRFSLRITDFEPVCRVFVPGMAHVPPYVRYTVRRRAARYLAQLRKHLA